jgi:uncharacterized protein YjdB
MPSNRKISFVALRAILLANFCILAACGGGGGGGDKVSIPTAPTAVLTTINVSLSAATLQTGQSGTASAAGLDQNGAAISLSNVTWSSSNTAVATVSSAGQISAVSAGTSQITATSGLKSGQASLTVVQAPVASVAVTPATSSITVGGALVLTATPKDAAGNVIAGKTVSWTATDINSLTGVVAGNTVTVTGRAAATVTVYATVDGVAGSATVTVANAATAAVASVVMSVSSITLNVNQVSTVTASPRDASGNVISGKTVTWGTSDGSIVGGSVNGNSADLQGVAAGSATVTATVGGKTGQIAVTVRSTAPTAVATVTISPTAGFVAVGGAITLLATTTDASGFTLTGRTVSWTMTGLGIIANGVAAGPQLVIAGLAAGSITVTATSEGKVASATVIVLASGGGVISLTCTGLQGGSIRAQDGQFLGSLTSQFASLSILNQYGIYGSQFSATSIYNPFSQYGSPYATYSAYNQFSNTPPILYVGGQSVAYVTKNNFKTPHVDPDFLRSCVFY